MHFTSSDKWPLAAAVLSVLILPYEPLHAQQFLTDDAVVAEYRAFQLEAWYGRHASWILPAFSPVRNLEMTAGLGFAHEDGGTELEYVLQAKYLFAPLETNGYGLGIVAGIGAAPIHQSWPAELRDLFANVPAGISLWEDALALHANAGWFYVLAGRGHEDEVHEEGRHGFVWGIRADVALTDRFTLISELFGEDRYLPQWHVGLRTIVIPHRLELEISYGGHFDPVPPGMGFNVGFAWTPPPF